MKEKIVIEGGHTLHGEVRISGSKNATVALIPAVCLASGPVTIYDVPGISDVEALSTLLQELNIEVKAYENHLVIDPTNIQNVDLNHEAVNKLRASYYFMGSLLGRFKYVRMKMPGGCYLGPRPIDLHIKGFEALGATCTYKEGYYEIQADELIGNRIYLDIASVGATINIMMAAVYAKGRTCIENAAKEPEIIDVATMLNKMGANIRGAGTDEITIDGVESLSGCFHEIIPDRIEAGTYIVIAALCGDRVKITNVIPQHLEAILSKLEEANVQIDIQPDHLIISKATNIQPIEIKTMTYPGFSTDLQSLMGAFLTQANGISTIKETIYPERFKYCQELNKMGADIIVNTPSCLIKGPTKLQGVDVEATDLRCAASLVIAGLMAEGITTMTNTYHLYRGYENIIEKLKGLNAKIWEE